ncbi:MAG: DUF6143 family protein [Sedimentibacter sp.]
MLNYTYGNNPKLYKNKALYTNFDIYYSQENLPTNTHECFPPSAYTSIYKPTMNYNVDVPINLAKSLEGKYFIGYADSLPFGEGTNAWARLYNPTDSGVNLHVTVWTVSDVTETSYTAQVWFNSNPPPGIIEESNLVTPSNTALCPLPQPRIKLQYAISAKGLPSGGIKAFIRRAQPDATLVSDEEGKFIFPPGGSFMIFLQNPQTPAKFVSGSIAFGWWEEPI